MCVAYKGNLVAFMTNPGIEDPLDTPAAVLRANIPIGMYNYQGSTTLSFEASTSEEYAEIWEKKHWIESFSDTYEAAVKGPEYMIQVIFLKESYNEFLAQFQVKWFSSTTASVWRPLCRRFISMPSVGPNFIWPDSIHLDLVPDGPCSPGACL